MNISTARMVLVPATAELVALEIRDNEALGRALGAEVLAEWPPEQVVDALPWFLEQLEAKPALFGWLGWYGLRQRDGEQPLLVASGGFFGLPEAGVVEVGYSVLPDFWGHGYATEMVGALVEWALCQPAVRGVVAEPMSDNMASIRVLDKLGFSPAGTGREPGSLKYERTR